MTEPGDSGACGSVLIANGVLEVGLDSFTLTFSGMDPSDH